MKVYRMWYVLCGFALFASLIFALTGSAMFIPMVALAAFDYYVAVKTEEGDKNGQ